MWAVDYSEKHDVGKEPYFEIFAILLERGARTDLTNRNGWTVKDYISEFEAADSKFAQMLEQGVEGGNASEATPDVDERSD